MAATGPKVDIWLVKTVGVLVLAIGLAELVAVWRDELVMSVGVLALTSSSFLIGIDIYYSSIRRISRIYLVDAAIQVLLLLAIIRWLFFSGT